MLYDVGGYIGILDCSIVQFKNKVKLFKSLVLCYVFMLVVKCPPSAFTSYTNV